MFSPSPRWVRTTFGGETVASSKRMMLLHEPGKLPVYYFPHEDVRMQMLTLGGQEGRWTVRSGGREAPNAAWTRDDGAYFAFDWAAMDHWFEEDDEVFKHARDPFHRVDVLRGSRHVRVELDGEVLADTERPSLLFETGLPTRYYIPRADVNMKCLTPSDTHTICPYKGTASYWSLKLNGKTYEDYVWTYPAPIPECPKIWQLLAFYNERVDTWVDGELQARPKTNF